MIPQNWEKIYPWGDSQWKTDPPQGPQRDVIDRSCIIPLIAKYAVYVHILRPSDEMLDDIYDEAMKVAKAVKDTYIVAHEMSSIRAIRHLVDNPAKSRIDKVTAVETVVSGRHSSGKIFEKICPVGPYENKLIDTVLILLAA